MANADKRAANRKVTIGVVGGSCVTSHVETIAEEVGRVICRTGANLVCGGLGGVMEAACRGFVSERKKASHRECGITIGILPSASAEDANSFVDVVIPTGMGIMRNFLVVWTSHIVVAVDGGSGTLSEISAAWQKGRPVVAMANSGGWAQKLAGQAIDDRRQDVVMAIEDSRELEQVLTRLIETSFL